MDTITSSFPSGSFLTVLLSFFPSGGSALTKGCHLGLRELRHRSGERHHCKDVDKLRYDASVAGRGRDVGSENLGRSVTESGR